MSGVLPSGHVVVTFEQQQQRCTSELAHCLFVATSCSSLQVGGDGPLARSVVRSAPGHFLPPEEFILALLWSTMSREKPMRAGAPARRVPARRVAIARGRLKKKGWRGPPVHSFLSFLARLYFFNVRSRRRVSSITLPVTDFVTAFVGPTFHLQAWR